VGSKYTTETISGWDATPPSDDGTVSEANKVKYSTVKGKLSTPLKTAIENIDSKLTTHFNVGPTALITNTTLDSTHFNKVIQVSGSGVTLTLSDAATLTAGWFCDIISTDASNSVTLARTTGGNTINETAANITILSLQELRVIVNAAANGFLVSNKARHSKAFKTAEDYTHSGTLTMSGKSIIDASGTSAGHASTLNIWSSGNYFTPTGGPFTFTDFADAPQAGAEVELYCDSSHVFTDNANLEVDGDANWAAEAGDRVLLRAKSTTVFTVHPRKKTGNPIADQKIGYKKVASGTASAAATLDIDITPYYSYGTNFEVVLDSLISSSDDQDLYLRVSTDSGVSYNAGATDYKWVSSGARTVTGALVTVNNADAKIILNPSSGANMRQGSAGSGNVTLTVFHPNNAALKPHFKWDYEYQSAGEEFVGANGGGTRYAAQDTDHIRFLFASGNISCNWALYALT